MRRIIALLLLSGGILASQAQVTFRVSSQLVIVNVGVRTRNGEPIEKLKKENFRILEDGKPQAISVFEFQRLETAPSAPAEVSNAPLEIKTRQTAIATSKPGQIRYQDRRLMVLFFDFSSMAPAEQIRAQKAALQFLEKQMTPSDLVAIMTFADSLKVQQDFTDDRDLLTKVIKSFQAGEASDLAALGEVGDDQNGEDTGAVFVPDETEFNIFNTDRKLSALESAAKLLTSLPERKALVYFSSGVSKTGVENQSQLLATVNAAVRANVAFYPIDARGLLAQPPVGSASQASPRGTGVFSGAAQQQQRASFNDQQETLYSLAAETGGKALLDNNDLSVGIVQAQKDIRSYYILGYYSTNPAEDGKFRRIKVELTGPAQARLDYRPGYFAPKQFKDFNTADKERQLEEALRLGDPFTDLPVALEVNYFRLARDRYFVPVAVKIPGSEIPMAHKGAGETAELDFIGEVRDAKGRQVASVRDAIRVKLTETDAGKLNQRHLQYDSGFTLPPGDYRLKFLARENRSGKMGTFETAFRIPDLSAVDGPVRMSSVVWSNQREPLAAAVGRAQSDKKLTGNHPLVWDGQKLIPSITKVFRQSQDLLVYFEVYDPSNDPAANTPDLEATLSFYRGKVKVFESDPVRVNRTAAARQRTAPFQIQTPLAKLAPGRYTCQLNVVDDVGRRFNFARTPIVLAQ
jgi:VWFA-related protein